MPTPKTHYRIALGEKHGQHSWIIHSAKGIKWHNIPDELVALLQNLSVNELLDFSLGSDGRWYVRYRQNGLEKHELSPYLWMDLGQGSSVQLDRLTLGPDADHWGVHRAADGSFQRFSSVGTRDAFTQTLDPKIENIKSNNQIWFVSLGFNGSWVFSVNGYVQHRCGGLFHKELAAGWKVRKRVSTITLSPITRLWVVVWDDGTLSHNLPFNLATEVEDYCQLQHSLKANSRQPNSGGPKAQRFNSQRNNNQPSTATTSAQKKQPMISSAQPLHPSIPPIPRTVPRPPNGHIPPTVNTFPVPNAPATVTPAFRQQPATRAFPTLSQVPKAPPVVKPSQTTQSNPQTTWQVPPARTQSDLLSYMVSQEDHLMSTEPEVHRKTWTSLRVLNPSYPMDSPEYKEVAQLFEKGWKHDDKERPKIKSIYVVSLSDDLNESYQAYRDRLEKQNGRYGVNEKLVFHGTLQRCSLSEDPKYNVDVCKKDGCSLCCILRTSFQVSKSGSAGRTFKRFGSGIYTSSVSSKADDYACTPWYTDHKVIIVARAAFGRSSIYYRTTEQLTAPPPGYDSVLGEVGIDLNHDEQVLYQNDAIRPAYIVIYERPSTISAPVITAPRPAPRTTTSATTKSSTSSGCTIM